MAFISRRRFPRLSLALGWMAIGFLPVSNIIPLFNPFAERYLYFSAIGFALVPAVLFSQLPSRSWRPGILAAACVVYALMINGRLADWKDDSMLWTKTLAQEPRSARAHTYIGLELKHRGDIEEALRHFNEADKLNPRDVSALINIGVLYGQQGRLAEAEAILRKVIQRRPDKADAHWDLAVALHEQGKDQEARAEIRKTLELDPLHTAAHEALRGAVTAPPPSDRPSNPALPEE